uniref:Uncharacterized protein n=1 Tax=Arundo donax TaxID=35708 RepID=A0A0A8XTM5_ARUDO
MECSINWSVCLPSLFPFQWPSTELTLNTLCHPNTRQT